MGLLPDWATLTFWQKVKWIAAGVGVLVTLIVILILVITNWSNRKEYLKLLGEKKDLLLGMFYYFKKKDQDQSLMEEKTRKDLSELDKKIRNTPEVTPIPNPVVNPDPSEDEIRRKAAEVDKQFNKGGNP